MADEPLGYVSDVPQRRLSDLIAQAFFRARNAGDVITAGHLLAALESLIKREAELYPNDRRSRIDMNALALQAQTSLSSVEIVYDPRSPPQIIRQPQNAQNSSVAVFDG